jgi:Ig-like domain-containing protein
MLKTRLMKLQIFLALGAILLASCGGGNAPEATPTMDPLQVSQIQTLAVATFSSDLTMTAIAAPSSTPAATLTAGATIPALPTSTGGVPLTGTTPGAPVAAATSSCYGLTFVSDVSIPDNTQMDPGETFTKTWKVQNNGSCAWDAGFKFQNTGGEPMGSAFTLPASVAAGQTYDISVPMTAPDKTGTLRSNWRMSTANGQYFGDEVFVVIVVGNASAQPTNTVEATSTP